MIFEYAEPSEKLQRLCKEILLELGEPIRVECKAGDMKTDD